MNYIRNNLIAEPMQLPAPKTTMQEVLLTLINKGEVSIMDYPYLSGFRTRISELTNRYGVVLETQMLKGRNKYDRRFKYALHKLKDKSSATKTYIKIVKGEV